MDVRGVASSGIRLWSPAKSNTLPYPLCRTAGDRSVTCLYIVFVIWHLLCGQRGRLHSAGNTRKGKLTHYDTLMIKLRLKYGGRLSVLAVEPAKA